MGIYLVGTGPNTWDLDQAYQAASDGDTLEFDKDFIYELGQGEDFIINKNITLCGYAEDDPEGGKFLYSGMRGRIVVRGGAEVVLRDITVYSNTKNAALRIEKNSKVRVEGSIIGNINEANDSYLINVEGGEVDMENPTFVNEDGLNRSIRVKSGKVKIKDAEFDKIFALDDSKVFLTRCEFSFYNGNVINAENSKVFLTSSYLEGGNVDKDWPAIFIKKSQITIKDSTISQPNYPAAVFLNNNSQAVVEDSNITSIKATSSIMRVKDSKINEIITVSDLSLAKFEGDVEMLGENPDKVDINADWNSVVVGENLTLHRVINPNMRTKNDSFVHITNLEYPEGKVSDLIFDIDTTSTVVKNSNNSKAITKKGTANKENNQQTLSAREQLDSLIGLRKVKNAIDEMLNMVDYNKNRLEQGLPPEKQSLHAAFVGNPGTGKTTVARLISEILFEKGVIRENNLVEVSRTDLVGQYKGHTGPQTRKVLDSARGGVLFIDEAYTLMTGEGDNFGQEAIDEIMKYMEDNADDIMVILAGYTKEITELIKANPGLKSRVTNTFDFEDYTPEEIAKMGEANIASRKNILEDKDYYEKNIKRAYSATLDKSNGRWIRNINDKISKALAKRVVETGEQINLIKNVDIDAVMNSGKYEDDGRKKDAYVELNKLIGIKKVKEQVDNFINKAVGNKRRVEQGLPSDETTLHSLFLGNPGTGKTTVARLVAEILYQKDVIAENKVVEVSRTDLVAGHIGQTAIKTRKALESALGGVLFIDEAYALAKGGASDFGKEAVDEIIKFSEDYRDDIVIILAGYTNEMQQLLDMNSGFTSRFPNVFDFEDYTPDEIVEIGLLGLHRLEYVVDEKLYAQTIKELYKKSNDNSNGRWVRNMNQKLTMNMSTRVSRSGGDNFSEITEEDLKQLRGTEISEGEDAYEKLNKLIGIKKVKEQVDKFISQAENNKRRQEAGLKSDDFYLHSRFLGNPGTGKTTVARLVGKILYQKGIVEKDIFVEVSRADLVAGYVGQTAQKTRDVLEKARGGVLFVDEAYTLSIGGQNDFGREAVDELMKYMEDNHNEIVIIFAGYSNEIDQLINMNPGLRSRMPNIFDFEDYSPEEIVEIGLLQLANSDYKINEEYYGKVVKELYAKTNDHSNGRWIRNVNAKITLNTAMRLSKDKSAALDEIFIEDIDRAVEDMND